MNIWFWILEEIERQIAYYKERDLPYPPSLVGKRIYFRENLKLYFLLFLKKNYKKNVMKKNNK